MEAREDAGMQATDGESDASPGEPVALVVMDPEAVGDEKVKMQENATEMDEKSAVGLDHEVLVAETAEAVEDVEVLNNEVSNAENAEALEEEEVLDNEVLEAESVDEEEVLGTENKALGDAESDGAKDPDQETGEKINADGDEEVGCKRKVSEDLPFPLARVKRIVRLDKEIKLVSHPGLVAITRAAALFTESLASRAFLEMQKTKRKSLRLGDLDAAVRRKKEFLEFLDDSMDIFAAKEDPLVLSNDDGEGEEEPNPNPMKKMKQALLLPGTRSITDFFGKK